MCVIEALVHSPLSPKRHNLVESRYECVIRREIEREREGSKSPGRCWYRFEYAARGREIHVRFWEENNAVIRREAEGERKLILAFYDGILYIGM